MNKPASSGVELRIERLIAAPPEKLFAMWTDPKLMALWFAPDEMSAESCAADATPGGKWQVVMRHPAGRRSTVSGVFRAVEPPKRLVFTWAWLDETGVRGHETEVTVTFEPAPGGTRLTLVHRGFATEDGRRQHNQGWDGCLDKLAGQFA